MIPPVIFAAGTEALTHGISNPGLREVSVRGVRDGAALVGKTKLQTRHKLID